MTLIPDILCFNGDSETSHLEQETWGEHLDWFGDEEKWQKWDSPTCGGNRARAATLSPNSAEPLQLRQWKSTVNIQITEIQLLVSSQQKLVHFEVIIPVRLQNNVRLSGGKRRHKDDPRPHRPKHKMSTDKTKEPVIFLLPAAAPYRSSFMLLSLTFFLDSKLAEYPGPARSCEEHSSLSGSSVNTSRLQANKQHKRWFKFESISDRNLLKTAVSHISKSFRGKQRTRAASVCPCSRSDASCCCCWSRSRYPEDPATTKTQTDHIRHPANKELPLHKGEKNQRGDRRADGDRHRGVYPDMAGRGSAWADNKHCLGLSLSPPCSSDLQSCSLFSLMWLWSSRFPNG